MSLAILSGFTQGLGAGMNRKRDQKEKEAAIALRNRELDVLEAHGGTPFIPQGGMGAVRSDAGGGGGMGQPVSYEPQDGPVTLDSLLYAHEGAGNPDTLFGHSQRGGAFDGVKVSEMTIDQAGEFSRPSGPYGQWVKGKVGRVATPMGYGQIVGTTLRNAAAEMGLPGDTPFNRETQGKIINHLAKRRLSGARSPAAKRAALRAEWEGFKNVSDATLDRAIANFEQGGGVLRPRGIGTRPI